MQIDSTKQSKRPTTKPWLGKRKGFSAWESTEEDLHPNVAVWNVNKDNLPKQDSDQEVSKDKFILS